MAGAPPRVPGYLSGAAANDSGTRDVMQQLNVLNAILETSGPSAGSGGYTVAKPLAPHPRASTPNIPADVPGFTPQYASLIADIHSLAASLDSRTGTPTRSGETTRRSSVTLPPPTTSHPPPPSPPPPPPPATVPSPPAPTAPSSSSAAVAAIVASVKQEMARSVAAWTHGDSTATSSPSGPTTTAATLAKAGDGTNLPMPSSTTSAAHTAGTTPLPASAPAPAPMPEWLTASTTAAKEDDIAMLRRRILSRLGGGDTTLDEGSKYVMVLADGGVSPPKPFRDAVAAAYGPAGDAGPGAHSGAGALPVASGGDGAHASTLQQSPPSTSSSSSFSWPGGDGGVDAATTRPARARTPGRPPPPPPLTGGPWTAMQSAPPHTPAAPTSTPSGASSSNDGGSGSNGAVAVGRPDYLAMYAHLYTSPTPPHPDMVAAATAANQSLSRRPDATLPSTTTTPSVHGSADGTAASAGTHFTSAMLHHATSLGSGYADKVMGMGSHTGEVPPPPPVPVPTPTQPAASALAAAPAMSHDATGVAPTTTATGAGTVEQQSSLTPATMQVLKSLLSTLSSMVGTSPPAGLGAGDAADHAPSTATGRKPDSAAGARVPGGNGRKGAGTTAAVVRSPSGWKLSKEEGVGGSGRRNGGGTHSLKPVGPQRSGMVATPGRPAATPGREGRGGGGGTLTAAPPPPSLQPYTPHVGESGAGPLEVMPSMTPGSGMGARVNGDEYFMQHSPPHSVEVGGREVTTLAPATTPRSRGGMSVTRTTAATTARKAQVAADKAASTLARELGVAYGGSMASGTARRTPMHSPASTPASSPVPGRTAVTSASRAGGGGGAPPRPTSPSPVRGTTSRSITVAPPAPPASRTVSPLRQLVLARQAAATGGVHTGEGTSAHPRPGGIGHNNSSNTLRSGAGHMTAGDEEEVVSIHDVNDLDALWDTAAPPTTKGSRGDHGAGPSARTAPTSTTAVGKPRLAVPPAKQQVFAPYTSPPRPGPQLVRRGPSTSRLRDPSPLSSLPATNPHPATNHAAAASSALAPPPPPQHALAHGQRHLFFGSDAAPTAAPPEPRGARSGRPAPPPSTPHGPPPLIRTVGQGGGAGRSPSPTYRTMNSMASFTDKVASFRLSSGVMGGQVTLPYVYGGASPARRGGASQGASSPTDKPVTVVHSLKPTESTQAMLTDVAALRPDMPVRGSLVHTHGVAPDPRLHWRATYGVGSPASAPAPPPPHATPAPDGVGPSSTDVLLHDAFAPLILPPRSQPLTPPTLLAAAPARPANLTGVEARAMYGFDVYGGPSGAGGHDPGSMSITPPRTPATAAAAMPTPYGAHTSMMSSATLIASHDEAAAAAVLGVTVPEYRAMTPAQRMMAAVHSKEGFQVLMREQLATAHGR